MAKEEPKTKIEKEFIIPLRREVQKVPKYQRANRAIRTIKKFLVRHMKIYDRDVNKIRIDKFLNEFIWARGIKKPPIKIKVKAIKEEDIVRVELVELPEQLKFKKARLEKRAQKATEVGTKKKVEKTEEAQKPEEKTEEEIKEEKEKKASVVQAGKEIEKKIAKTEKHQTKLSKQPKHQFRQALQK